MSHFLKWLSFSHKFLLFRPKRCYRRWMKPHWSPWSASQQARQPEMDDQTVKQRSPSTQTPPPLPGPMEAASIDVFAPPPRGASLKAKIDWKDAYSSHPPLYPAQTPFPEQAKRWTRLVSQKTKKLGPGMIVVGFLCTWIMFGLFSPRPIPEVIVEKEVIPMIDPLAGFTQGAESPQTDFRQKPIFFTHANSGWDNIAVALKTGQETALKRVPVQAATLLRHVKKWILIGEDGGINIGDREMIDVYSDLYTSSRPKPGNLEPTPSHYAHDRALYEPEESGKSDRLVPNEKSDGWKKDAHKNLPGFIHLWNRFPDADWYFMIDDDTYMFFANVMNGLKNLDPELPHYWGAPTMFVGCDGVTRYGDGPNFAHGGSGIVISRGSMRKMMSIVDNCIDKYKTCWAGDVRTALCLRDAGVLVGWHKTLSFNGEPPRAKSWWPADACSTPGTFHHLVLPQIQSLYNIEYNNSMGLVTFGDLYQHFLSESERDELSQLVDKDTNRAGLDYKHVPSKDHLYCSALCEKEKDCRSWSWEPPGPKDKQGECWLKEGVPGKVAKPGTFSGVHMKDYVCRR
jgi:hypothetical protein